MAGTKVFWQFMERLVKPENNDLSEIATDLRDGGILKVLFSEQGDSKSAARMPQNQPQFQGRIHGGPYQPGGGGGFHHHTAAFNNRSGPT